MLLSLGKLGKKKQLSVMYSKVRNYRIRYFHGERGEGDLYKSTNKIFMIKCLFNLILTANSFKVNMINVKTS